MNLRDFSFNSRAQIDVKRSVDARRQSRLQADLGSPQIPCFANAPKNLFSGQEITLLRAMPPAESAEAASLHADISEIDVSINDIGDSFPHPPPPQIVRSCEQPAQIVSFRGEQRLPVL